MINNELYDHIHAGSLPETLSWLDQRPDDLNAVLADGYAPLHVACMFGQTAIVEILLSRQALVNIEAQNASRATPLHLAIAFRDESVAERIARMLIDNGAELNAMQTGGQTPLHHAVARGSLILTRVLIEAGADPFLEDDFDHAPTDLAKTLSGERAADIDAIRAELKRAFERSTSVP